MLNRVSIDSQQRSQIPVSDLGRNLSAVLCPHFRCGRHRPVGNRHGQAILRKHGSHVIPRREVAHVHRFWPFDQRSHLGVPIDTFASEAPLNLSCSDASSFRNTRSFGLCTICCRRPKVSSPHGQTNVKVCTLDQANWHRPFWQRSRQPAN